GNCHRRSISPLPENIRRPEGNQQTVTARAPRSRSPYERKYLKRLGIYLWLCLLCVTFVPLCGYHCSGTFFVSKLQVSALGCNRARAVKGFLIVLLASVKRVL